MKVATPLKGLVFFALGAKLIRSEDGENEDTRIFADTFPTGWHFTDDAELVKKIEEFEDERLRKDVTHYSGFPDGWHFGDHEILKEIKDRENDTIYYTGFPDGWHKDKGEYIKGDDSDKKDDITPKVPGEKKEEKDEIKDEGSAPVPEDEKTGEDAKDEKTRKSGKKGPIIPATGIAIMVTAGCVLAVSVAVAIAARK